MPPMSIASGVEPPATAAMPPVLSCIAIPGESTETLMATASMVRSWPFARPPVWLAVSSGRVRLIGVRLRSSPGQWCS